MMTVMTMGMIDDNGADVLSMCALLCPTPFCVHGRASHFHRARGVWATLPGTVRKCEIWCWPQERWRRWSTVSHRPRKAWNRSPGEKEQQAVGLMRLVYSTYPVLLISRSNHIVSYIRKQEQRKRTAVIKVQVVSLFLLIPGVACLPVFVCRFCAICPCNFVSVSVFLTLFFLSACRSRGCCLSRPPVSLSL